MHIISEKKIEGQWYWEIEQYNLASGKPYHEWVKADQNQYGNPNERYNEEEQGNE
jgi:hypothetical protein